jgi:hypothetical protein
MTIRIVSSESLATLHGEITLRGSSGSADGIISVFKGEMIDLPVRIDSFGVKAQPEPWARRRHAILSCGSSYGMTDFVSARCSDRKAQGQAGDLSHGLG